MYFPFFFVFPFLIKIYVLYIQDSNKEDENDSRFLCQRGWHPHRCKNSHTGARTPTPVVHPHWWYTHTGARTPTLVVHPHWCKNIHTGGTPTPVQENPHCWHTHTGARTPTLVAHPHRCKNIHIGGLG